MVMGAYGGDPAAYLKALGEAGDGPHDIARAALMLAALDHARIPRSPYEAHLNAISEAAGAAVRAGQPPLDAVTAVAQMMTGQFGYDGDRTHYDAAENADLMAVIDRRRGLPVALGILYIHAARAAGCVAEGLASPGHFLLRVIRDGHALLIDPFNSGAVLEPERLGGPLSVAAVQAEAVSDTDVLLRLQNNIRLRALQADDRPRAVEIARRMVLIAPRRADLWIELARHYESTSSLGAAKTAYESGLALAGDGTALHNEAALALHALKRRLN